MSSETIQLDHSAGGGRSGVLIDELIATRLGSSHTGSRDGEALELDVTQIAMTIDTFVVDPIFFDGGDIGRLAVCATVNDLAASGAVPRYLVLSLVIEQGLAVADLTRVLDSVCLAAAEADVEVVAGDTQVVRGGETDKLFLTAAGVGEFVHSLDLGAACVGPGDAVIVTGSLGDHGIQILALREGLDAAARVPSDFAPLGGLVWNVLEDFAPQVHCMRDLARGGLAGTLNELADAAGVSIELEAHRLPIGGETRRAAERLGCDPLHLPSGGGICLVVDGAAADDVVELVRWQPQGEMARIVGTVRERACGAVTMVGPDGGGATVLEPLRGVELPRLR